MSSPNLTPSDKKFSLTPNKVSCALLTRNWVILLIEGILLKTVGFYEKGTKVDKRVI